MQVLRRQVRVCRGGKRKYWRRKYESAGLEYASTENISTQICRLFPHQKCLLVHERTAFRYLHFRFSIFVNSYLGFPFLCIPSPGTYVFRTLEFSVSPIHLSADNFYIQIQKQVETGETQARRRNAPEYAKCRIKFQIKFPRWCPVHVGQICTRPLTGKGKGMREMEGGMKGEKRVKKGS